MAFDGGGNGEDGYGLEDGNREGDEEKENKCGGEAQEGGKGDSGVMSERSVVRLHWPRHEEIVAYVTIPSVFMIVIVVLVVLEALPTLSQSFTPE